MLNNKIHIVLLTDCMANTQAGAEKQIFELAKRLDKNKYKITIASLESGSKTPRNLIETIGCDLQTFPVIRIYGISGLVQGLRFKKFLQQNQVDILQTYHFGSDIWGTFWGHRARVRSIISNRRDMGFWRKSYHVLAYKLMDRWVNKIVTVTSSVKQMVMDTEDMSSDKIEVIYNGVDFPDNLNSSSTQRTELGIAIDETVIMHVANLRPVKGHCYLIEAFAKTIQSFPKSKLVLIGKDELNGELQTLVKNLNISDHVLFLGQRSDIAKLLPLADICVLPSLSEGMSNAILEYMTFGKPVIATNVGGNPELIQNGHNGLLVPKENPSELSQALLELLKDKEKRQTMGKNAFQLVKEQFSMQTMLDKYIRLYQIKVLHVVSSGGLFGAEQVILTLAGCANGVTQTIGALNNQHNPHLEIIEEGDKRKLATAVFTSKGRFDLKTIKEVQEFLLNNSINIIHTHNYKANIIGFLATRFSSTKWIATIHGWIGTDTKLRWYEQLDSFILKFAHRVVCVSESNYQSLLKKNFPKDKLIEIPNGININKFSNTNIPSLRETLKIDPKTTVLAIIGRLAPEKGHEILLQALKEIIKDPFPIICLIVGEGPLRNSLEEQVRQLGLSDHVRFTGIQKDMPPIYKICDILVNASYTEGLPMTILEAMAAKRAIIATKVGAVPQVITDHANGLLIPPGDPKALVDALRELIKNPQFNEQLSQKAYEVICSRFSDERMAQEYKNIYQEVLTKKI